MPYANEDPEIPLGPAWQLRGLIARNRYANHVADDVYKLLGDFYGELSTRIASGKDLNNWQQTRLKGLQEWAGGQLQEIVGRARHTAIDKLNELGDIEQNGLRQEAQSLRARMGLPSRAQLIATADFGGVVRRADIGGTGFGEWWQTNTANALKRMQLTVQSGLLQGYSPREIARKVISSDRKDQTLASVDAVHTRMAIRTAATAVSTEATKIEHREMKDVLTLVRFEAVLDPRTSKVCMANDGKTFEVDSPDCPQPPLHPNCRSALVGIPDFAAMGLTEKDLGQRVSYEQWLRKQPPGVQDQILGRTAGQAFRDRKLALADLIDQDRTSLTAKQLRAKIAGQDAPVQIMPPAPAPAVPVAPPSVPDVPAVAPVQPVRPPKPARVPKPRPVAPTPPQVVRPPSVPDPKPGLDLAPKPLTEVQAKAMKLVDREDTLWDDEIEFMQETAQARDNVDKLIRAPFKGDGLTDVEMILTQANDYEWDKRFDIIHNDVRSLPVERVKVGSLYKTQPHLDPEAVKRYITKPDSISIDNTGKLNDLPRVVRFQGKEYLLDGHHRAAAQKYLGETDIDVRLIDIDAALNPKPKLVPVPSPVAQLKDTFDLAAANAAKLKKEAEAAAKLYKAELKAKKAAQRALEKAALKRTDDAFADDVEKAIKASRAAAEQEVVKLKVELDAAHVRVTKAAKAMDRGVGDRGDLTRELRMSQYDRDDIRKKIGDVDARRAKYARAAIAAEVRAGVQEVADALGKKIVGRQVETKLMPDARRALGFVEKSEAASDWLAQIFPRLEGEDVLEVTAKVERGKRSSFNDRTVSISMVSTRDTHVWVHELVHAFEHKNPVAGRFGTWMRNSRAKDLSVPHWLPGYARDERFLTGDYPSEYMGKVYGYSARTEERHTEILTMALEMMYRDPDTFLARDPRMFREVIKFLRTWRTWKPPQPTP